MCAHVCRARGRRKVGVSGCCWWINGLNYWFEWTLIPSALLFPPENQPDRHLALRPSVRSTKRLARLRRIELHWGCSRTWVNTKNAAQVAWQEEALRKLKGKRFFLCASTRSNAKLILCGLANWFRFCGFRLIAQNVLRVALSVSLQLLNFGFPRIQTFISTNDAVTLMPAVCCSYQ